MNDTVIIPAITGLTLQFLLKIEAGNVFWGREEKKYGSFQRNPHSH